MACLYKKQKSTEFLNKRLFDAHARYIVFVLESLV